MKFPLQDEPFAPLMLTWKKRQMFLQLAQRLLDQDLQEYEQTCALNGGQAPGISNLNRDQWQMILQRENVAVFKEVTPKTTRHHSSSAPDQPPRTKRFHGASVDASSHNNFFPLLQAVGTIAGTLDDVMYGLMTYSDASSRIKSSYVGDNIVDSRLLYELEPPSEEEPFHFAGIKWIVKTSSPALMRPRDYVFLQSIGITKMATSNDRIGYQLMHSIQLDTCPSLHKLGICRGQIFSSYLYREIGPNKVQVTMRCVTGPRGKLLESLGVHSAANGLMGNFQSVYCAQMKKLAYFVLQNHQRGLVDAGIDSGSSGGSSNGDTNTGGTSLDDVHSGDETPVMEPPLARSRRSVSSLSFSHQASSGSFVCGSCRQGFHVFFSVSGCKCRVCLQETCKRCLIAKRLSFESQSNPKKVKQKRLKFCKACITKSNKASSLLVAQQELRQRDDPFWLGDLEFSTTTNSMSNTNPHANTSTSGNYGKCFTNSSNSAHNTWGTSATAAANTGPPVTSTKPTAGTSKKPSSSSSSHRKVRKPVPAPKILLTPREMEEEYEEVDEEFDTCDMQRVLPAIQRPPPTMNMDFGQGSTAYQHYTKPHPASVEAMCDQIHELLRTTEKTFQCLNQNKPTGSTPPDPFLKTPESIPAARYN